MVKTSIFLVSVFTSISSFAQLSERDSLFFLKDNKNYDKALEFADQIIQKYNNNDSLTNLYRFYKGLVYEDTFSYDSALDCYEQILENNPRFLAAINGAASMYGEMRQYESAYKLLDRLKDFQGYEILRLSNIVYYKGLEGKYDEAIMYSDTAMVVAKDSLEIAVVLNNRGFANLKLEKFETALKDIEKSLTYFPSNSYAYRNLALVYMEQKKLDKACAALNKARELGGIAMTQELLETNCK